MTFFTSDEFLAKYPDYTTASFETWQIEASSEMIFSQVGKIYRDANWTTTSVPLIIKNASMEQLRYMIEQDLPYVDVDKHIQAGEMNADLSSDYSTLALRMLANGGYLYRGNKMTTNMGLGVPFGE